MTEFYYRYYDWSYDETRVMIDFEKFRVVKRTPKGAWVEELYYPHKKRFILDGARRRYAYPTKELAADSYRIRKEWQVVHAERTIRRAENVLEQLKKDPAPVAPARITIAPVGLETDIFK